jgi:hypothetical protein
MPRKSDPTTKAAVTSKLKAMFKTLEARPMPDTIRSVVDQLDDGAASRAPKKTRKRG